MAYGNIAVDRRPLRYGLFRRRGLVLRRHNIKGRDVDAPGDILHGPVIEPNVFDAAAAAPPRLDANAHLRAIASDVTGHQITDPAGNFAAQHYRAMSAMHSAIGDGNVFSRPVHAPPIGVFAGLDHDAVLSRTDVAIGDAHVAAGIDVDPAGIVAAEGFDHDSVDDRIVVIHKLDGPHGRPRSEERRVGKLPRARWAP